MRLLDAKSGAIIWEQPEMTGDSEYQVEENKIPELARNEAANRAIDRLAKNIVDRIVEDW
jgi:hypothetical protein